MSDLTDKLKKKLEDAGLNKKEIGMLISAGSLAADLASTIATRNPAASSIIRQVKKTIKDKKDKKKRVAKSKMTGDAAYKLKHGGSVKKKKY